MSWLHPCLVLLSDPAYSFLAWLSRNVIKRQMFITLKSFLSHKFITLLGWQGRRKCRQDPSSLYPKGFWRTTHTHKDLAESKIWLLTDRLELLFDTSVSSFLLINLSSDVVLWNMTIGVLLLFRFLPCHYSTTVWGNVHEWPNCACCLCKSSYTFPRRDFFRILSG